MPFQKTKEEGTPPNTIIPNLDKDSARKLKISLINIDTSLQ